MTDFLLFLFWEVGMLVFEWFSKLEFWGQFLQILVFSYLVFFYYVGNTVDKQGLDYNSHLIDIVSGFLKLLSSNYSRNSLYIYGCAHETSSWAYCCWMPIWMCQWTCVIIYDHTLFLVLLNLWQDSLCRSKRRRVAASGEALGNIEAGMVMFCVSELSETFL